jgi:hypothetical protein
MLFLQKVLEKSLFPLMILIVFNPYMTALQADTTGIRIGYQSMNTQNEFEERLFKDDLLSLDSGMYPRYDFPWSAPPAGFIPFQVFHYRNLFSGRAEVRAGMNHRSQSGNFLAVDNYGVLTSANVSGAYRSESYLDGGYRFNFLLKDKLYFTPRLGGIYYNNSFNISEISLGQNSLMSTLKGSMRGGSSAVYGALTVEYIIKKWASAFAELSIASKSSGPSSFEYVRAGSQLNSFYYENNTMKGRMEIRKNSLALFMRFNLSALLWLDAGLDLEESSVAYPYRSGIPYQIVSGGNGPSWVQNPEFRVSTQEWISDLIIWQNREKTGGSSVFIKLAATLDWGDANPKKPVTKTKK